MRNLRKLKDKIFIACVIAATLLVAGCGASTMAGYESAMKEILKQAKSDLVAAGPSAAPNPSAPAPDDKIFISALEKIKNQLDGVNPPDDLFAGHSDIKEFIELTIESRKGQAKSSAAKKGRPPQPPMDVASVNAARQALDRAKRELPFLDYELSDAFSGLLQPSFAPSPGGFGAPNGFGMPPGMGAPASRTRQSPIRITPSGSPIRITPSQQKPPGQ